MAKGVRTRGWDAKSPRLLVITKSCLASLQLSFAVCKKRATGSYPTPSYFSFVKYFEILRVTKNHAEH